MKIFTLLVILLQALVKNTKLIKVKLISNQQAVVAGLEFAKQTFKLIDSKIKFIIKKKRRFIS